MTKPSEKLWENIGILALMVITLFSVKTFRQNAELNKEISVPVTVKNKYHQKDDYGNDQRRLVCYNKEYGTLDINVTYDCYDRNDVGDDISFSLSKYDIDGYSDSYSVNDWIPVMTFVHGVVIFILTIVLIAKVRILILRFNDYYDEKMTSRKERIKNKI